MSIAREIAARSPHAIRGAKRLLNMAHDADPRAMLETETKEQGLVIGQSNMLEQVAANMERRAAIFADRSSEAVVGPTAWTGEGRLVEACPR